MCRQLSISALSWFMLPLCACVAERLGGSLKSLQAEFTVEVPVFPGEGKVNSAYPLALQKFFEQGNELPRHEVLKLLNAAETQLKHATGTIHIMDIDIPKGCGHMNVIGDLHGQIQELFTIFKTAGHPSETNPYLFNGDYVDRGSYAVEVVLLLLAWKQALPHHVHLNRGNHEFEETASRYGFYSEVQRKYSMSLALISAFFDKVFRSLPLAHVISKRVFVTHGGIPTKAEDQDLSRMKKVLASTGGQYSPRADLERELMWNDPREEDGFGANKMRGGNGIKMFGKDVTRRFLERNHLTLVIRSHEVRSGGISLDHDLRNSDVSASTGERLLGLMTVFSAANYGDSSTNVGGIIKVKVNAAGNVTVENVTFVAGERPEGYIPAFYYMSKGATRRTTTTVATTTTTAATTTTMVATTTTAATTKAPTTQPSRSAAVPPRRPPVPFKKPKKESGGFKGFLKSLSCTGSCV